MSDHNLTLVARKLIKTRCKNENQTNSKMYITFIPKKDLQLVEKDLIQTKWADILEKKSCEQGCHDLMLAVNDILIKYTKKNQRKRRAKRNLPWFNKIIEDMMKKRDMALKKFLKSGLTTDRFVFTNQRNKVTAELRKAKASFFLEIIRNAQGNSRLIWKTIDKLIGKEKSKCENICLNIEGKIIDDSFAIATNFNDYFLNNIQKMAQNFHIAHPLLTISDKSGFNLSSITKTKVEKIITVLNNSKAKDIYGLDTSFLKQYKDIFSDPLTIMINQSISEGIFPAALKPAIVTPIFKSGNKQDMNNYRPISILPAASKVLEKTVAEQLTTHFESQALLNPMQFGFRRKYSTDSACCYFLETIRAYVDRGRVVGAVFLDLRKAFDTVNHQILYSKLNQYSLSEHTQNWIRSYLSNRHQCVQVNNIQSVFRATSMGVPQGSILGPLLFSIYINDLPTVCSDVDIIMYADDTVIFTSGENELEVADKLSKEMQKVAQWLHTSCLTLNVDKTVSMFFSNKRKLQVTQEIQVNGQTIKNVKETKYLGLILDSNLGFKSHIKNLSNKLKFNLMNYKHIRNSLTTEASNIYLNTMIVPHLLYCMSSWSQACKTSLKLLESLYKRAIKIHDKKPRQYHHCKVQSKYNILSFENLIKYNQISALFKIIHNIAAPPLRKFVTLNSERISRATRSTVRGECSVPKRRTTYGQQSFFYKAANLWNILPNEIISCTNHSTFTRLSKQWLLLKQTCTH